MSETPDSIVPKSPTPKKRRRLLKILAALVVLLLLFVILLPTLAGLGFVRSIVLGKINENIDGRVEIADWSLGWGGPIDVTGIKVYDSSNRLILDAPHAKIALSFLNAIRQNFALGEGSQIDIASFSINVDEAGVTNLEKLPKAHHAHVATEKKESTKLPDVSGKVTVNFQGTIEGAGVKSPIHVDPSSAVVTITNINEPIENTVNLVYRVGDGQPSTIQTSGTFHAIRENIVDINRLTAGQKVTLGNVNLAAAEPFLKALGANTRLAGLATGGIDIKAEGITGISATGEIVVQSLLFGGGPLGKDQFQTSKISIPIHITRTTVDANTTVLKFDNVGMQMSQGQVNVTGQVNEEALLNLANHKAPGSDGSITILADITDLPNLANQLKNTIGLQEGVAVTGGAIHQKLTVTFSKDRVAIAQNLQADAKGTRDGKPIELKPVTAIASLSALPNGKAIPDIRDIQLAITSSFANFKGGGQSLSRLNLDGNFDLDNLNQQVSQFVDFGGLKVQGKGTVNIVSTGDVSDASKPINTQIKAAISNLVCQLVDQPTIQIASLTVDSNTSYDVAANQLKHADVTLQTGDGKSSIIDLNLTADGLDPAAMTVKHFDLTRLNVMDLAAGQKEIDPFVTVLDDNGIHVTSGQLFANVSGSFNAKTRTVVIDPSNPLSLSITNLTAQKTDDSGATSNIVSGEKITGSILGNVSMPSPGTITAQIKTLALDSASGLFSVHKSGDSDLTFNMQPNAIGGAGQLAVSANAKSLMDIAQRLGLAEQTQSAGQLTSGQLDTTVALSHGKEPETVIQISGTLKNLSISQRPINNETVTISLGLRARDDLSAASAAGTIQSAFANLNMKQVQVALSDPKTHQPIPTMDKLQQADIDISAPDLAKADAIINAFMPTPTTPAGATKPQAAIQITPGMMMTGLLADDSSPPKKKKRGAKPAPAAVADAAATPAVLPPLEITSGAATMSISANRDVAKKMTHLAVTNCSVSNLALSRGQRNYTFDSAGPIMFKLDAQMTTDNAAITSINIQSLDGDLRVAKISAQQPIVLNNLSTTPTATGAVTITGKLDDLTPLLAVLQGADALPYGGAFSLAETITNQGDTISLVGDISAQQFTVYNLGTDGKRGSVAFSEPQVAIKHNVTLNTKTSDLNVGTLTVDMPTSKAVGLKLAGSIHDYAKQRKLDNITLSVCYDLAKLWPIVHPMLITPGQEDSYADLKIGGAYQEDFSVSGSYPSVGAQGQPLQWYESVKTLSAAGSLKLDLLDTSGLNIQQLQPQLKLTNGILKLDGTPAVANEGKLDFAGIVVDLTQSSPVLTTPKKKKILMDVKLNPVLAGSLGKFASLVLSNATKASGLLDVTILECNQVPLGALLRERDKANARIGFSVRDLSLDGPVPQAISTATNLGSSGLQGNIKDGNVTLANGQATSDVSILLQKEGTDKKTGQATVKDVPLRFTGGIGMAKLDLRDFKVIIPPDLLPSNFRKYLPGGLTVPFTGTVDHFKFDFQQALLKNGPGALLQGGGGKDGGDNGLGGLLQDLAGKKKDKTPKN